MLKLQSRLLFCVIFSAVNLCYLNASSEESSFNTMFKKLSLDETPHKKSDSSPRYLLDKFETATEKDKIAADKIIKHDAFPALAWLDNSDEELVDQKNIIYAIGSKIKVAGVAIIEGNEIFGFNTPNHKNVAEMLNITTRKVQKDGNYPKVEIAIRPENRKLNRATQKCHYIVKIHELNDPDGWRKLERFF